MRTANYTEFRTNLKSYIDSVVNDCDIIITVDGEACEFRKNLKKFLKRY